MKNLILITNSGSSSVRIKIFDNKLNQLFSGRVERISLLNSFLNYQEKNSRQKTINYTQGVKNHAMALKLLIEVIPQKIYDEIKVIGHRVVHGGEDFQRLTKVTPGVLKKLEKYNKLAPLHNPINLKVIKELQKHFNEVDHFAMFDTVFFRTMPDYTFLYSLPLKFYDQYKIRKFGFHGLSHQNMLDYASQKLKMGQNKLNLITCHLGGGSSISLIKNGQAFDTSMGFTPLEGVTMSTRSGDLDPAVIIYLIKDLKLKIDEVKDLLNFESGVFGISGLSDLREVLQAAGHRVKGFKLKRKFNDKERKLAKLALKIFIYDIQRYITSYAGFCKKINAIVFSGAIGNNHEVVRSLIMNEMYFRDKPRVIICPTKEEQVIASNILKLIK